jgi:hypothetical protein
MQRKAAKAACFYVLKAFRLKDINQEELTAVLQANSYLID